MTDQQIQKDYMDFINAPYPFPVADWIWKKLPVAIMHLPQTSYPYSSEKIIGVLHQKKEEITIADLGMAVNLLLSVAPVVFGWPLNTFLEKRKDLENIRNTINTLQKDRENSLKASAPVKKMEAVTN